MTLRHCVVVVLFVFAVSRVAHWFLVVMGGLANKFVFRLVLFVVRVGFAVHDRRHLAGVLCGHFGAAGAVQKPIG